MDLSVLQAYVRDRLTIRDTATVKTTQITTALNRARDRLVADFELLVSDADLTFTADAEEVTLPAGVLRILSIRTASRPLEPVTRHELVDYLTRFAAGSLGPLAYLVDGSTTKVRIWPASATTEVVTNALTYVPQPAELSDPTDEPDEIPRGYHDLLAELAVIRIAQSEEAEEIARGAQRIVYGNAGNPLQEPGLMAELRQHMRRRPGSAGTRIWPRGYA